METKIIKEYLKNNYGRMFCPATGDFKYPSLLPVSSYAAQLWDWGSYFSDVAIRQIAMDLGKAEGLAEYEKGCVLNFLESESPDGSIPIVISSDPARDINKIYPHRNVHKPVIAQHAAFVIGYTGETEWIKDKTEKLEKFITFYEKNAKHESGLFYFFDDFAIGVDNDPCTFFRPDDSSASIYLNTLMFKELGAMEYIFEKLGNTGKAKIYADKKDELKKAIDLLCYDEKDGFYYSCDINLRPVSPETRLHKGAPRHYSTLIQRLGVWSGFLPMWAGIASPDKAERMVRENLLDKKAYWGKFGVRTLSKYEKMYRIVCSSNPSSWQGGVWIISNYLVFRGLVRYGYEKEARELCEKTVKLLSDGVEKYGAFHEYYDPETGEGVCNRDFLSWNMLVANMIAHFENGNEIKEF